MRPVTSADLAADAYLKQALSALTPHVPVLTEEAADIPFSQRANWRQYWLVDPSMAPASSSPVAATSPPDRPGAGQCPGARGHLRPESDLLYWAVRGHGAFKEANGESRPISAIHHEHDQPDSLVVAISRRQKLENLTRRLNPAIHYELIPLGSSSLSPAWWRKAWRIATCAWAPPGSGIPLPPNASWRRQGAASQPGAATAESYNETESLENPDSP
jgi:3'(2'), 5'-bisphosphate nucleotidase